MENGKNRIKIYNRIMLVAMALLFVLLLVTIFGSKVEDVKLASGDVYDFNTGWTLTFEDGTEVDIDSLPYTAGGSAAYETIVMETTVPEEYWGKTLFFLSAGKELTIYMDDVEIYSFGTNNQLLFGHAPGSNMNFVDLPEETSEGVIRIEMMSPYKDSAAFLTTMRIADRDIAILKILSENTVSIIFSIVILFSGVILFVFDLMQLFQKRKRYGMGYLGLTMVLASLYYAIETKIFHIWFGNQVAMAFLVLAFHMLFPITFTLYYMVSRGWEHKRFLQLFLVLSYVNVAVQVILQLLDVADFINMSLYSHILIFAELIVIILDYAKEQLSDRRFYLGWLEIFALFLITGGSAIDLVRYYQIKVGDLAKFGRYGTTFYVILVIFINIRRMVQDATEEMEAQNEMLKASELRADKANRAKSEFLSNMSHEIRTPLNTVIGMNEMILRDEDDPQITDYAAAVQNSANALLLLINDILDISKIEEGKMEIVEDDYELTSLVADSYNMVADRLKKKGLEASVICDPSLPTVLHGDMLRLRQILINLLTNAVKYTEQGRVEFSIKGERDGSGRFCLRMSVKDTGIGMTPESLERLFSKFERFDLKHNQNIEGTGLGLSITKELVSLMHGEIWAESEYGKGSTFIAVIPQGVVNEMPVGEFNVENWRHSGEEHRSDEPYTAPNAKLLVVDDVEMNLKVFVSLLRDVKCKIDTALSGKECIALAQKQKYDIIFMDHMMPGMDGVETLRELQKLEDNPNKDTPIIMLTANALSGERERYLAEGFIDYLAKPIRGELLEDMVRKYLSEDLVFLKEKSDDDKKPSGGAAEKTGNDAQNAGQPDDINNEETPTENAGQQEQSGLDREAALDYCAGDEEILNEMLTSFVESGFGEKLDEMFEGEDWANYQIEVHALKSTSLTIGAAQLSAKAKELEAAAKEGNIDFIRENHRPMEDYYQSIIAEINEIVQQGQK
ncbi:MAG: ATP-binding protein [Clostridiales bacterium]|nr:ATP-binding protein [Clostridiales bacterium]